MSTHVSVSFSGPAFSFLLYENSKCSFQQEGFLLGEIVHEVTKTITDNDQHQVIVSKIIKINSNMPCPEPHYFYDGIGKVDGNKVREFLGNQFDKVVAWYKYQRVSSFKFTLRDKVIHRELTELFDISPELFTCCLLINEASDNGSTHLFSQTFMRYHNGVYDRLSMHIPNLSEPNNTYKSSETASETFNNILKDLKIDGKNTQGVVVINKIQNALQKHIDTVVEDLSEAEKKLHQLEEEVKELQAQKMKKMNDMKMDEAGPSKNETVFVVDSSPEAPRKAERTRDAIDSSSSQEPSPEVRRKAVRGRPRGRGKRRNTGGAKDVKVDPESSRLKKKE